MYSPAILSARAIREHPLDNNHRAILFTDIVSEKVGGVGIDYAFLLSVVDEEEDLAVAFITSEISDSKALRREMGMEHDFEGDISNEPDHMLCAFLYEGHFNYGSSPEWGKLEKFEAAALDLAKSFDFIDPDMQSNVEDALLLARLIQEARGIG